MKIRTSNITYNECDSFDEIQKHLNDIYGILRDQEKRIAEIKPPQVPVVETQKKGARK